MDLADRNGRIVYQHYDEGGYKELEAAIISLLERGGSKISPSSSTTGSPFFKMGEGNRIAPDRISKISKDFVDLIGTNWF